MTSLHTLPPSTQEILYDRERLQEILDLDLASGDVRTILDDLTRAAAQRFHLPVGLVSIVLGEAQHFASQYGLEGTWLGETQGTPIEWSFCRYSVERRQPFVVENAAEDPRFSDNPLVCFEGLRCYAGMPLITSRGLVLGALCVIGFQSREINEAELADLRALADEAVRRLEERVGRRPAAE